MVQGVEDGKGKKAIRREVQRRGLQADNGWSGHQGSLSGAAAWPGDSGLLVKEVSGWRSSGTAISQGEDAREASGEIARQNWATVDADRYFKKIRRDGTTEEKRRAVSDNREQFGSVSKACEALGISQSSYYYKSKIDPKVRAQRDSDLRGLIEQIQSQFPQYGVRQVYWELLWSHGKRVNRKRLHRVMREHGLRAQIYRGFKVATTDSNHSNRIYPNLLHGEQITRPNQAWVTDITYVRIQTCFVYVAAVLDLFSRRVIGWAVSTRINTELCLEAVKMAVMARKPEAGCVHHSDRGVQYTSDEYVRYLKDNGLQISMSRKGNCWDNAHMESFFGTLKREEVHLNEYETFTDVIMRLPHFIEGIYNERRRHSSIGGLTPVEFENKWLSGDLQKLGIPSVTKLWQGSSN